ncbi:hypothetical protein J2Z65_001174 [Paenibacillus aceris]|uniref:Uncharacterized protein n=1 Tax=Paenibacillus aceris TaxID=869555 RepID=A0ABS4HUA5_9BACL|nr:hypothetical protein [Paenibacillus aceris]
MCFIKYELQKKDMAHLSYFYRKYIYFLLVQMNVRVVNCYRLKVS